MCYNCYPTTCGYCCDGYALIHNTDGSTSCEVEVYCPENTYRDVSTNTCSKCYDGYSPAGSVGYESCQPQCLEPAGCCDGVGYINGVCTECPGGSYKPTAGNYSCTSCDFGQSSNAGSTSCYECPTSRLAYYTAANENCIGLLDASDTTMRDCTCDYAWGGLRPEYVWIPIFVQTFVFTVIYIHSIRGIAFISKSTSTNKLYVILYVIGLPCLLSFMDNISDLIYVASNPIFVAIPGGQSLIGEASDNRTPAFLSIFLWLFYWGPSMYGLITFLYKENIQPAWYFGAPPSTIVSPTTGSTAIEWITYMLQISPYLLLNLPWMGPLILFGFYLYAWQLLPFKKIYNEWTFLYSGLSKHSLEDDFHFGLFNEALYIEIAFETFPQLILQFVNTVLLAELTPIGTFSIIMSILSATCGIYQIIYYKYIKGIELRDAPSQLAPALLYIKLAIADKERASEAERMMQTENTPLGALLKVVQSIELRKLQLETQRDNYSNLVAKLNKRTKSNPNRKLQPKTDASKWEPTRTK
jgi:hypothetical protein